MGFRDSLRRRIGESTEQLRTLREERRERRYLRDHPSLAVDQDVRRIENDFYTNLARSNEDLREIARKRSFDLDFIPLDPAFANSRDVIALRGQIAALEEEFFSTIKHVSVPDVAATSWEMLRVLADHLSYLGFTATEYPDTVLIAVENAMRRQLPQSTFVGDPRLRRSDADRAPTLQPRRCADGAYAAQLLGRRNEPHVASLNELVDTLRHEHGEWVPYVAPTYGGMNARVLALFQHTGPWARLSGSDEDGLLSLEHQGDFAARHLSFLAAAGIEPGEVQSWNVYPWASNGRPSAGELKRGVPVLRRVVSLLPDLTVVVLHGRITYAAWDAVLQQDPSLCRYLVVRSYDTSSLVVSGDDAEENERRQRRIATDLLNVSKQVRSQGADCAVRPQPIRSSTGSVDEQDEEGVPFPTEPPSNDEPPFPDDDE